MRLSIAVLLILSITTVCLLAENFFEPGVYIIDGRQKPCKIEKWSHYDSLLNEREACSIVDVSFFIRRMGSPKTTQGFKKYKNSNKGVEYQTGQSQSAKVIPSQQSKSQWAADADSNDNRLTITEDDVSPADYMEEAYNGNIMNLFNKAVSSMDKYESKEEWAKDLSHNLNNYKNFWQRSSADLKYVVHKRLDKIFPGEYGLSSVITDGELRQVLSWEKSLESQAESGKDLSEFKTWSTSFLTTMKHSSLGYNSRSYLKAKLDKIYKEMLAQKPKSE